MKLPKTRTDLLVKDLSDEVLIYDLTTNKSYCLNSTAKVVFNACNGKTMLEDLKLQADLTDDIIYFSLDELKKQNLFETEYVSPFAGMNRREVIRKVGLASMIALPMISALIAPLAANAASGCQTNVCLAPGTDTCAGCVGKTITYTVYTNMNTSCANPLTNSTVTCAGNNPQVSNSDRRIINAV